MIQPIIYQTRPKFKFKVKYIDAYPSALGELFFLKNPSLKKNTPHTNQKVKNFMLSGRVACVWVFYPESKTLIRLVNEKTYFSLRTARNKNLITEKQQNNFRNLSVGIAGLSVGSSVVSALVISGGPKKLKIADFDVLEITNLNRIKGGLPDIGNNKTSVAAREIWQLDPFAQIKTYEKGLDQNNLNQFLLKPKLDVFIDEMDSLPLKIQARIVCKNHRIPTVMATDNGDSVVLDVERFDLEPKRKIFHGLLGQTNTADLNNLNYKQWLSLATKIVGPEYLTPAMQDSLLAIGKTLPAVPQLGTVAGIAGAAVCFVLRRIANKQSMPSGRYVISLEEKLIPGYTSKRAVLTRNKQTKKFAKLFSQI